MTSASSGDQQRDRVGITPGFEGRERRGQRLEAQRLAVQAQALRREPQEDGRRPVACRPAACIHQRQFGEAR